jgi:hypothetical protein
MFLLIVDFKYFMRELLPLGAIEKAQLPVYLTSWVDKTSPLCMYTMTHTRVWSNAHLKAGCWYTDCGKVYCPLEEEDVKKACVQADSKGAALGTNQSEEQEDEVEVDINLLLEKERNKILNQRARDKKKAEDKAEKDAEKAKEKEKKEGKKGEKSGKKSKPSTPPLLLTETSYASPSQNPRKRDASTAQLSLSRLQQLASPALGDSAGGALHVQEFFFSGSLLSIDAYYVEHKAFPTEWVDMKAFLEMVCIFSFYLNAS